MDLTGLTIVQLLEEHNRLSAQKLNSWKDKKDVLAARVSELQERERTARRPTRTIKSAAYEMLLFTDRTDHKGRAIGLSYDEILAKLVEEFPGAATTDKCLRWYQVQLNGDGAKIPWRPRRSPRRRDDSGKDAGTAEQGRRVPAPRGGGGGPHEDEGGAEAHADEGTGQPV